jgi:hypothetical protein
VYDGVLAWEREAFRANCGSKHFAVKVEMGNRGVDGDERVLIDNRSPNKVTEFDDIGNGLDDCWWYMAGDSW